MGVMNCHQLQYCCPPKDIEIANPELFNDNRNNLSKKPYLSEDYHIDINKEQSISDNEDEDDENKKLNSSDPKENKIDIIEELYSYNIDEKIGRKEELLNKIIIIQRTYKKHLKNKNKKYLNFKNIAVARFDTFQSNGENIVVIPEKESNKDEEKNSSKEKDNNSKNNDNNTDNGDIGEEESLNNELTKKDYQTIISQANLKSQRNFTIIKSSTLNRTFSLGKQQKEKPKIKQSEKSTTNNKFSINSESLSERCIEDETAGHFLKKQNEKFVFFGKKNTTSNKREGFGIVLWDDKSILKGLFTNGLINGISKFFNSKNNALFTGNYINNVPQGFGIYENDYVILQGYWDKNQMYGVGYELWEDGSFYQGEYDGSKRNGIGLYRWPDGTIYQGEFLYNEMTGFGLIIYNDDKTYSGELLNGRMNGFGRFSFSNNSIYIGYYFNDLKHGFGVYIWSRKPFICFIGFWEMGQQQGAGVKIVGNKIKYGLWRKGKITTSFKGLYDLERHFSPLEKKYYKYFKPQVINKIQYSELFL